VVETGRDRSELPYFTDEGKFVPSWLARDIMADQNFVVHKQSEEMYYYKEGVYKENGEGRAEELAQEKLGDFVKTHYVNEAVNYIRRDRQNRKKREKFGNPKESIVVENGILDVKSKELREHTPDEIHLSKIPVEYDEEAEAPRVKQFMEEVLHPNDIPLIQELFGYCLLKDYPLAKAFMFLGSGANGKSTLINLLDAFLGEENTVSPSLQGLLEDKFAAARLHGKLACLHADIPDVKLTETGKFKMLTGQDPLDAQKKYKDRFTFYNHAKLVFSANQLPRTEDRTKAFYRRWIIVEFPNEFPEDDPDTDPNILDKLTTDSELSGVLNWALAGLDRLMEQGHFSRTKGREKVERKWIRETDSLRAFCDFALKKKKGWRIVKKDLWDTAYKEYCDQNDLYAVKEGVMTRRLPSILTFTKKSRPKIDGERVYCWENLGFTSAFKKEFEDAVSDVRRVDAELNTLNHIAEKDSYTNKSIEISNDTPDMRKPSEIEEVRRLLSDDLGRTSEDVADELDMDFDKAEAILKELYDQGHVKKKRGADGSPLYMRAKEGSE